jgi:hypothetical protein
MNLLDEETSGPVKKRSISNVSKKLKDINLGKYISFLLVSSNKNESSIFLISLYSVM